MKRFLGMSGMVLAVLGALISIVMLIGGWYGRGVINDTVAQMLPGIDQILARESDQLATVGEVLDEVNSRIDAARTRVQDFSSSNAEDITSFVQSVEGTVQRIVTPIQNIRAEIATLRSSILMFASFWNGLPGFFNLPDLPTERLQEMDDRSRQIDARVEEIEENLTNARSNIAETRATIAASLDNLDATLTRFSEDAASISARLEEARGNLTAAQGRINAYATLAAIFLTVLGLCALALFVNLFYSGWLQWEDASHTWLRSHTSTTTTDVTTHTIEGGVREVKTVTVTESEGRTLVEEEISPESPATVKSEGEQGEAEEKEDE